jgi:large subunit ribosomal protein L16
MLFPKNQKYKKQNKGRTAQRVYNCTTLNNFKKNNHYLKTLGSGLITLKQLKSIVQVIKKIIKKKGYFKLNVFPQKPITKKPIETRMGKGKGAFDTWVVKIKAGQQPFEVVSKNTQLAFKALGQAKKRLHIKSSIK